MASNKALKTGPFELTADHYSALERLSLKSAALESANQELHKLDDAKQRLTDMIVHDLQNPLAGIVALLQLLESKTEGLTQEERAGVREGLSCCNDLSRLILNVLQVSRAETGKLKLAIENVDAAAVARRAAEALALVAKLKGRHIKLDVGDEPAILRADEGLLRRILDNLIRNALRHTPTDAEVSVRVRPGPPLKISVCDSGPGIPTEIGARIFEPFVSRAVQGTGMDSGLGLSFCKMAADAMGLNLRLETAPGNGACFILEGP